MASRLEARPGCSGSSTGAYDPTACRKRCVANGMVNLRPERFQRAVVRPDSVRAVPSAESHTAVLACAAPAGSPPRFVRSSRAGRISVTYRSSHGSRVRGAPTSIQRRFLTSSGSSLKRQPVSSRKQMYAQLHHGEAAPPRRPRGEQADDQAIPVLRQPVPRAFRLISLHEQFQPPAVQFGGRGYGEFLAPAFEVRRQLPHRSGAISTSSPAPGRESAS